MPLTAKSLYQLFLEGCGNGGLSHTGYRLENPEAHGFVVDYIICADVDSRAAYLNVFITKRANAAELLKMLATEYKGFLSKHLEHATSFIRVKPGEAMERAKGWVFTGVIGIYHEGLLMPGEPEEVRAEFEGHGAHVRFYGPDYVVTKNSPLYSTR